MKVTRTLRGLTLGVSDKREVARHLGDKGLEYTRNISNTAIRVILPKDNALEFGGGTWQVVEFKFVDDLLAEVIMTGPDKDNNGSFHLYEKVRDNIALRYGSDWLIDNPNPRHEIVTETVVSDCDTTIMVGVFECSANEYFAYLRYGDEALISKRKGRELMEL